MKLSLAALLAMPMTAGGLAIGQEVCVEGFVMDRFCIDRGTLLDNPSVVTLEEPGRHSVHCLIDVNSCISSPFEVLLDPTEPGGTFARGFLLSEAAKNEAVVVAKEVGICDDCVNTGDLRFGFRAAFEATIVDLGTDEVPPLIDLTAGRRVIHSAAADPCAILGLPNVLTVANITLGLDGGGGGLRAKHLTHGTLMMISWGLLLPSGVLIAKFLKHRPDGLWFRIHQPLQITGLLMALVGWIIALRNFNVFGDKGYTNYYHGVMGCTVMAIGLFQPINAFLRPHPPEAGQEKAVGRLIWEVVHKSLGWVAVLLAVATISLGTTLLGFPADQKTYQLIYGIGCGGSLLMLIIFICWDKANFGDQRGSHAPVKTHDDMEGRRYHS